jgi:TRAP transporter TAXI family solute receptor
LFVLILTGCSLGILPDAEEKEIILGSGSISGVYFPAGRGICHAINQNGSLEHCSVKSTKGSVDNIHGLVSGKFDIAIVQADVLWKAERGQPPFQKTHSEIRVLLPLYPEMITLVAREDSEISVLPEIRGKNVDIGPAGSGTERSVVELLRFCNIPEPSKKNEDLGKKTSALSLFQKGELSGFFQVVGHPSADTEAALKSQKSRIIPLTGTCIDTLLEKNPFLIKTEIPTEIYDGISDGIPTYGVQALLVTTNKMSESAVHEILEEFFVRLENFKKLHKAFGKLTPRNMIPGENMHLHEGAKRFYREKAWL